MKLSSIGTAEALHYKASNRMSNPAKEFCISTKSSDKHGAVFAKPPQPLPPAPPRPKQQQYIYKYTHIYIYVYG